MLNDDQSVPKSRICFSAKEAGHGHGVQADRGSSKHRARRELRTDLRSQADALILAPGQGGAGSAKVRYSKPTFAESVGAP